MQENEKSGYTAEGRKLRPRRPRISGKAYDSNQGGREQRDRSSYSSSNRESSSRRDFGQQERGDYRRSRSNYGDRSERRSGSSYGSSYGRNSGGYNQDRRGGYSSGRNGGYSSRGDYRHSSEQGESQDRRNYHNDNYSSEGRRNFRQDRPERRFNSQSQDGRRSYSDRNSERGNYRDGGQRNDSFRSGRPQRRDGGFSQGEGRSNRGFGFKSEGNRGTGFGRKPRTGNNPFSFGASSNEGITKMLSRKKVIDQSQISDNDYVPTEIPEEIRLNKYIANSGVCSRREADQFIQAGVVSVNGEVVTELGTKVNVLKDEIRFNGELLHGEEKVYIIMNKPKGYVTTSSDPHAEKTVMDLLKNCTERVFPVGRLDKNTTGVLLFTNDGDIAERLTHPSHDKKKIYQVIVDHTLAEDDYNKILEGVTLGDGDIKADELEYIDAEDRRKLGIEIHSGKNRIVRRIFESLGYDVKALDRVYFAGLTKKGLKRGEWRYLTEGEANLLKMGAYV